MLPVADGSDHGGSLRNPAAFNNVIALRPTFGRIPSTDEDPFVPPFSVMGPMARNVPDLQMLFAVQSGYDPRRPYSIPEPQSFATPPLALDPKGKRIAWIGDFGGHIPFEAGVLELCRNALRTLEGLGCIVEDVTPDFDAEKIFQNWALLRSWGIWKRMAPLYADPEKRKQLKPEAVWEFERCQKISGIDVRVAADVRTDWYDVVRKLFERYDYLVLPSAQLFPFGIETPWPKQIAGKTMDTYHRWMEVMIPVTFSGCPAIGVPVGFGAAGLPMGMQIVGPMRSEQALMQIAHAYDQATQWVTKALPLALKQ
jgi:amidase